MGSTPSPVCLKSFGLVWSLQNVFPCQTGKIEPGSSFSTIFELGQAWGKAVYWVPFILHRTGANYAEVASPRHWFTGRRHTLARFIYALLMMVWYVQEQRTKYWNWFIRWCILAQGRAPLPEWLAVRMVAADVGCLLLYVLLLVGASVGYCLICSGCLRLRDALLLRMGVDLTAPPYKSWQSSASTGPRSSWSERSGASASKTLTWPSLWTWKPTTSYLGGHVVHLELCQTLRTVWPAQSDPSITKVRLPSPGPSRAWMDYDVNGGTLTITVDPQTQLLAFDPVICAEIATYMEVICHSGTELGGESQDCTAAVSVCAAASVWAAVLERAQPRMSLDQANSFRARLMTEFYKLADYQTLLDLEKFIRHISLCTPELQTSTDGNTPPLAPLHPPGTPPWQPTPTSRLSIRPWGVLPWLSTYSQPGKPKWPGTSSVEAASVTPERHQTSLRCQKGVRGKKNVWGRYSETSTADNDFHFQAETCFYEEKKMWSQCDNLETPALFSHYCVISSLLCGRPKSNPPDWTDQSEHTIL